MGRFFQTSTPTFVDNKMFQLPYELMGKVLEKKDAGIQTDIDTAVALTDTLKAQALKKDEPELQKKIAEYQTRIDEQVQNIKDNVMNYDTSGIQGLKRDITKDWTIGDVAKMESNRTLYLDNIERIRKAAQAHPEKYDPGQVERLIADVSDKYEGYKNLTTGEYQTLKTQELYGTDPLADHVKKAIEGAVGKFDEIETDTESGTYRIKVGNKWEGWAPLKLNDIFQDYLAITPEISMALKQREDLGLGSSKDAIQNAQDYMVKKYQKVKVGSSYAKSLSEEGKIELTKYGKDDVGYSFQGLLENPYLQTFAGSRTNLNEVIVRKNTIGETLINAQGITGKTERKAAWAAIAKGDFSIFTNIDPEGLENYKEQIRDLNAQKVLQQEIDKDFQNWQKEQTQIKVVGGKSVPMYTQNSEAAFKEYKAARKVTGDVIETYMATNQGTGMSPATTAMIGKEIEDLKGLLLLDFQSAGKDLVFTDNGGKDVKLVVAQEDPSKPPKSIPNAVMGEKKGGIQLWVTPDGKTHAAALTPQGKVPYQAFMNLGLGQGTTATSEEEDFSGGENLNITINGKTKNLKLNVGSARLVDKLVGGQDAIAVPIQGADFAIIGTLDANVVRNPALQEYINNPVRKAEQKFSDWKPRVGKIMSPKTNNQTKTTTGKDSQGWFMVGKDGNKLRPGLNTMSEQGMMKLYYDATRQLN